MCKYCEGLHTTRDVEQDILVTHFIDRRNGRHSFLITQDSEKPRSVTVAVNYCPNCGEKLGEGRERKTSDAKSADALRQSPEEALKVWNERQEARE